MTWWPHWRQHHLLLQLVSFLAGNAWTKPPPCTLPPSSPIFSAGIAWSTVSKAFLRSRKTAMVCLGTPLRSYLPSSRELRNKRTACKQLCPPLKPNKLQTSWCINPSNLAQLLIHHPVTVTEDQECVHHPGYLWSLGAGDRRSPVCPST